MSRKYTAQEMREMSTAAWSEAEYGDYHVTYPRQESSGGLKKFSPNTVSEMLRQAADAEDELAQLKARLEAVVKDNATMTNRMLEVIDLCNGMKDDFSLWNQVAADFTKKVLRVARGEGGAE